MKIDKDFAVKINGELFHAFDIVEIHIERGATSIVCELGKEATKTIKCRTRDVELVTASYDEVKPKVEVEETRLWSICNGEFVSKKINCCLWDIKEVLSEAIKTLKEEQRCNVEISIDGKQFAKLVKEYNQDQGRRSGGD